MLLRILEPEDSTEAGIARVTAEVTADLERLVQWGKKWGLTFEADKNEQMVVSNKRRPASFPGLTCEGQGVKQVKELKLVGFVFDSKLQWAGMVERVRKKARTRLGALFRMCGVLDRGNRVTMYNAFIRSAMEYGCLHYMGAAPVHLKKLDQVQRAAERMCGCKFEQSLSGRREAAAFGLACKLLDGKGRGRLQDFTLEFEETAKGRTRNSTKQGIKLVSRTDTKSLGSFARGFEGSIEAVFEKVPQELLEKGPETGWSSIMKTGQRTISRQ